LVDLPCDTHCQSATATSSGSASASASAAKRVAHSLYIRADGSGSESKSGNHTDAESEDLHYHGHTRLISRPGTGATAGTAFSLSQYDAGTKSAVTTVCHHSTESDDVHTNSTYDVSSKSICGYLRQGAAWWRKSCSMIAEIVILIACSLLIVFVVTKTNRAQEEFLAKSLTDMGTMTSEAVCAELRMVVQIGADIQTVFMASNNVSMEAFSVHSRNIHHAHDVLNIAWLPHVSNADRAEFEQDMSQLYEHHLNISMVDFTVSPAIRTTSPARSEYYPMAFVIPKERFAAYLMTDMLSVHAGRYASTIAAARSSGHAFFSPPEIVDYNTDGDSDQQQFGFVSFWPVYRKPFSINTTGASEADLIAHSHGMLAVTLLADKVVSVALSRLHVPATKFTLCDSTDPENPMVATVGSVDEHSAFHVDNSKRFTTLSADQQRVMCKDANTPDTFVSHTHVFSRNWLIRLDRDNGFNDLHASSLSMQPLLWISMGIGFIVTLFVFTTTRRAHKRADENAELVCEMKRANEAKGTFVAFLCHELRNPLHAVISAVDELEDTNTSKDITNALAIGSQTMLAIVNDILDMSKIEAGAFDVSMDTMSLQSVLDAVIASHQTWAAASEVTLSLDLAENVPDTIINDQTRLTQILNNLISNALKFSNDAGRVTLSAHVVFDELEVDSGMHELEQDSVVAEDRLNSCDATCVACSYAEVSASDEEDLQAAAHVSSGIGASTGGSCTVIPADDESPVNLPDIALDIVPSSAAAMHYDQGRNPCTVGTLVLSVSDTGVGMNQEQLDSLFVPYTQITATSSTSPTPRPGAGEVPATKPTNDDSKNESKKKKKKKKKLAGTGIGLTIVSTIVEALGGEIIVESELGQGSTFSVCLPLVIPYQSEPDELLQQSGGSYITASDLNALPAQDECSWRYRMHLAELGVNHDGSVDGDSNCNCDVDVDVDVNVDVDAGADAGAGAGAGCGLEEKQELIVTQTEEEAGQKPVLLLVDDDKMNRRILRRHAERMLSHMELVECIHGLEAVEYMNSSNGARVRCICMDLNMPVMDGIEATEIIRQQCSNSNVLIIGVTANAFAKDREHCMQAGMDDVLPKPFRKKGFADVIVSQINKNNSKNNNNKR
jgi:signal transduction histidine kinase/CHASE1-domain containing sensor protein/ActR/RegA family two-component response regulator